ncbi:MAG: YbfB/YjiJ family MFS transporter [Acidimicrobiales bacterium]
MHPGAMRSPRLARPGARAVHPAAQVAVLAAASGVAQGFGRFTFALVLPEMVDRVLGSYAVAGLLGTVNLVGYLLGTATVMLASGRVAPVNLVRVGLMLEVVGLAVLAVTAEPAVMFLALALTGFGGALIWVPAPGIAATAVPGRGRGLAIGTTGSGIGASIVLASALAQSLPGPDRPWERLYMVEAVLAAAALAAALIWLRPAARRAAAPAVTGTASSAGPGGPQDAERSRAHGAAPREPLLRRLLSLTTVPGWKGVAASYAAYGLSYSVYMTYLVAALERQSGLAASAAFDIYGLVGLAIVAGGAVLGPASDRLGRRVVMVGGYVVMAISVLLAIAGSTGAALASAVLFGLMMSGLPAVSAAKLADHLDMARFAPAFGAITLLFGLTQLAGPGIGGWLTATTGSFVAAFAASAAAALLGAAASMGVRNAARRPAAEGRLARPAAPASE